MAGGGPDAPHPGPRPRRAGTCTPRPGAHLQAVLGLPGARWARALGPGRGGGRSGARGGCGQGPVGPGTGGGEGVPDCASPQRGRRPRDAARAARRLRRPHDLRAGRLARSLSSLRRLCSPQPSPSRRRVTREARSAGQINGFGGARRQGLRRAARRKTAPAPGCPAGVGEAGWTPRGESCLLL